MKKIVIFSTLLLMASSLWAAPIGQIQRLRGDVSVLPPGAKKAHQAVKGEKVYKDTSLLTSKRSFVRVKLNDNSTISLGPNGKIVLDQLPSGDQASVVGLIKGAIRSSVSKKDSAKKNKVLIKTPSAVMGVRGTEFQASYNTQNNMTSLVTLDGDVRLAKLDTNSKAKVARDNQYIDKTLSTSAAVSVDKARYSGVSNNLKTATEPVTINPVQYATLKIVEDFNVEQRKVNQAKLEKEIDKANKEIAKLMKKRNEDPYERFDARKGQYKPKSGGFVELSSGFYIPPSEKSELDEKTNLYKDANAHEKVTPDGSFRIPKGVKLDAKGGFIADSASKEAKKSVAKLNDAIKGQRLAPRKPSEQDLKLDSRDAYKRFFR